MRKRHRFVVAYDIRDPKRLRRVHRKMKEYGWAMQYSVFIADLDGVELHAMRSELAEIIDHGHDSIAMINTGLPDDRGRSSFSFMGEHPVLPTSGPIII